MIDKWKVYAMKMIAIIILVYLVIHFGVSWIMHLMITEIKLMNHWII